MKKSCELCAHAHKYMYSSCTFIGGKLAYESEPIEIFKCRLNPQEIAVNADHWCSKFEAKSEQPITIQEQQQ